MGAYAAIVAFWLANAWPSGSSAGPPAPRDINGTLINVGDIVKLVGTVTAINAANTHQLEITFQPLHPNGAITPPTHGVDSGPISPIPGKPVIQAAAIQLVVGS